MPINWTHYPALNELSLLDFSQHLLLVFVDDLPDDMPFQTALENRLKRSQRTLKEIAGKPLILELAEGALVSVIQLASTQSVFEQQELLRQAVKPLLQERPGRLGIAIYGQDKSNQIARQAAYVTAVNAQPLPALKREVKQPALTEIGVFGVEAVPWVAEVEALVAGNTL